uniref:Tetratricopeptide repeat domain 31 n=1 Tax=Esox lucius TaxID=8010 RepID=A0A6Q2XNX8_ESOLU
PVMDFVTLQTRGLNIGFLGYDFANHEYSQGDDDDDEDYDFEDQRGPKPYCGFSKNFLSNSSASYQMPRCYNPPPEPKPSPVNVSTAVLCNKESKAVNNECNRTSDCLDGAQALRTQDSSDTDSGGGASEEDVQEASICSDSEELDMTSSFFSKAADKAKCKLQQKIRPEWKEKKTSPTNKQKGKPTEVHQDVQQASPPINNVENIIKRSAELAVKANEFAAIGRYDVAVEYFTAAIKCNPREFRLFCNRAFCYEKQQDFGKALADAELALSMSPRWMKGLFRKARALAGLKRYEEAVKALKAVLEQDPSSVDAAKELMTIQITQLMELGFSREQSSNALIIHGTVEESLKALSKISGSLNNISYPTISVAQRAEPGRIHSDSGVAVLASTPPRPLQAQQRFNHNPKPNHQAMAVSNNRPAEVKLYPVWVGNLVPTITEAVLKELFKGAGHIHSMKLLRPKRCAFVNYVDPDCCENAISLHGREVDGVRISVRYPDRIPGHLVASQGYCSTDPGGFKCCFFWRNLGCNRGPSCPYRHVLEHHGIDRREGKTAAH